MLRVERPVGRDRLSDAVRDEAGLPLSRGRRWRPCRQPRARRAHHACWRNNAPDMSSPAIDHLLAQLFDQRASDLHLCVGMPPLMRKDGDIQPLGSRRGARSSAPEVTALLQRDHAGGQSRGVRRPRHDTDFAHEIEGARAVPRQRLRRPQGHGRRLPRHPVGHPVGRGAATCRRTSCSSATSPRGSCWSPARPGRASRRRCAR